MKCSIFEIFSNLVLNISSFLIHFLEKIYNQQLLVPTKSVVDSILLAITSQLVSNLKGFYYVVKRFTSMLNLCRYATKRLAFEYLGTYVGMYHIPAFCVRFSLLTT